MSFALRVGHCLLGILFVVNTRSEIITSDPYAVTSFPGLQNLYLQLRNTDPEMLQSRLRPKSKQKICEKIFVRRAYPIVTANPVEVLLNPKRMKWFLREKYRNIYDDIFENAARKLLHVKIPATGKERLVNRSKVRPVWVGEREYAEKLFACLVRKVSVEPLTRRVQITHVKQYYISDYDYNTNEVPSNEPIVGRFIFRSDVRQRLVLHALAEESPAISDDDELVRQRYARRRYGNSPSESTAELHFPNTGFLRRRELFPVPHYRHNDSEADYDDEVCWINKGEEDEMEIYGYERSTLGTFFTWICIVLTLGILRLVFHWYIEWMLYCTHRRCPLKSAEFVLIIDTYQNLRKTYHVIKVERICLENLSPEDVAVVCNDPNTSDTTTSLANEAGTLVRINFSDGSFLDESDLIMIHVKEIVYVWRDDKKQFSKLAGIEKGLRRSDLHNMPGYSQQQQLLRRFVYGMNEITVHRDSYSSLIMLEVLTPFYMFQVVSLILWFVELYLYYAFAIIIMSLYGIILTVNQIRENQEKLYKTVQAQGNVTVCRNVGRTKHEAVFEDVPINYLVPGDIIVIPRAGFIVPCDAVLLVGNCIVNESLLTGESVPVTKTPLPALNTPYNEREDLNHTLFCGTQVVQARYYANEHILAVVLRTGFLTAKGNLIRSIMHPIQHDFQFDRDCYRFISILGVIALIGTVYGCWAKVASGSDLFEVIVDSLDIITIVVAPALPAAMSVGKYYAQKRLLEHRISCMNTSVINVSGTINCVCFDKTGTLTEDGLDLYGVVPVKDCKMQELVTDIRCGEYLDVEKAMASCHSLTLINGVISGDPLDVKMFEGTKWILDETGLSDTIKYDLLAPTIVKSPDSDLEIGIIHQFQFSSDLQRMSVITRHLYSEDLTVYCKGSPEKIIPLSRPDSVPSNWQFVLKNQTEKGYRVIAIGYRTIPPIDIIKLKKLHRDEVERDLTFAALIIFENKLKPQTIPVIDTLQKAEMKLVMLTGDNVLTAICVARECGIVSKNHELVKVTSKSLHGSGFTAPQLFFELNQNDLSNYAFGKAGIFSISDVELGGRSYGYAMEGHTWKVVREYYSNQIPRILKHGVIFARMSSDQKQQVIQELQALNYHVAMCGDGANDCGALKAANVGISLSEAEASVASPFTSAQADISCVPKVIREGRAALVTAFGLFKFMVLYSMIQFFSTEVLFTYGSKLTDFQFLFIDAFLILITAFFFGQTRPYQGPLVAKAPNASLMSAIPVMSILTQFALVVLVEMASAQLVQCFPWYETEKRTYMNYAVYTVSQFQYLTLAVTFSCGKPYREPFTRNTSFFLSLVALTAASLYVTLYPWKFVEKLFMLTLPPTMHFRLVVVVLAFANVVLSLFLESFVVNYLLERILPSRKVRDSEKYPLKKGAARVRSELFAKTNGAAHVSVIEVKSYGTMIA